MPSGKGKKSVHKQSINLVGGNNKFTATASNKDDGEAD